MDFFKLKIYFKNSKMHLQNCSNIANAFLKIQNPYSKIQNSFEKLKNWNKIIDNPENGFLKVKN